MLIEVPKPDDVRREEMAAVFKRAMESSDDCDDILILMQRKTGDRVLWFGRDSSTAADVVYLATGFIHWMFSSNR